LEERGTETWRQLTFMRRKERQDMEGREAET
jgi:hypothetical protein